MIKSSNSGIDLKESRRWWDCGRKIRSEWTYEGRRTARRSRHYLRSRYYSLQQTLSLKAVRAK